MNCCMRLYYNFSSMSLSPEGELNNLDPVQTMTEEFENGVFTLKTHQMFSVHATPEESENATITFNLEQGNHINHDFIESEKLRFQMKMAALQH